MPGSARTWSSWPGDGSAGSRRATSLSGFMTIVAPGRAGPESGQRGGGLEAAGCAVALRRHTVGQRMKQSGSSWTARAASAVLAIKCCIKNMRRADFLEWKVRLAAPE